MYSLDFDSCTMRDVIARSVTCHPSLLADAMQDVADIHARAAVTLGDMKAANIARQMSRDAWHAHAAIQADNVTELASRFSSIVMTFHVASKLQCLPRHVVADTAARSTEGNR